MVSTNRSRANASSSTTPHLSLSQVGESVPQGSLSPSQQDVNIPQTPSSGVDSNTQKSVRGPTRGIALRKLNKKNKDKLIIHIDHSQEPESEGDEVDRINFHKHTHHTEGKGWITPQSENNHVEMEKRRIDVETRGETVDVDKIVDDVLGNRSSYIVGLGYGPKPNKSSSGMRILQDTLKEKDRECAELREGRAALMEEMNAMKSTLAEHTRLFEKLVQSQNLSSPW
ncbi:hypothetical protein BUALT_Bualt01G0097500 [Buddleja alternifolia]|uniref:Uncharacterized protein n=1 Tax=Buddleja alternifolia TaxID=168488 RepID=A0AAV6Y789_9LAMI|nr:hypothetical protein BUALT_Bualt01G0097500 [Buddleja alternifolia]